MARHLWNGSSPVRELTELREQLERPGVLVVSFRPDGDENDSCALEWGVLESLTRSRVVSVADMKGTVRGADRDVALCCDLVYLRSGAVVRLPEVDQPPTPGLVWALSRAGGAALWRGLTGDSVLTADEAVAVGLATAVVGHGESLPLPKKASLASLIATRDLLRCRLGRGPGCALELATFRLMFAVGDPGEGAAAFLEGRTPELDQLG